MGGRVTRSCSAGMKRDMVSGNNRARNESSSSERERLGEGRAAGEAARRLTVADDVAAGGAARR